MTTDSAHPLIGKGLLFALCYLFAVEALLHFDYTLHRYRSVFAAGRALDKVMYVEQTTPELLVIGNSRIDNGVNPRVIADELHIPAAKIFNLGIPGANARDLYHVIKRFERQGLLGPGHIEQVLLGLDESMVQPDQQLGYSVFLYDPAELWRRGELNDLLRSTVRLWGFNSNLKNLREPAKLLRLFEATFNDVPPVGGEAKEFQGYRKADNLITQNRAQLQRQHQQSFSTPDVATKDYLIDLLELLEHSQVKVGILFPPVFGRTLQYLELDGSDSRPYRDLAEQLQSRRLPFLKLDEVEQPGIDEFANAGHLNDKGATRFSRFISRKIKEQEYTKL